MMKKRMIMMRMLGMLMRIMKKDPTITYRRDQIIRYENALIQEDFRKSLITNVTDGGGETRYICIIVLI